jgi:hypothetical protein
VGLVILTPVTAAFAGVAGSTTAARERMRSRDKNILKNLPLNVLLIMILFYLLSAFLVEQVCCMVKRK